MWHEYDRENEVKMLEESKAGVKGMVDAGITSVPRLFIHEHYDIISNKMCVEEAEDNVPLIDLEEINQGRRKDVIQQVMSASQTLGFFQVINHGIPLPLLDQVLDEIRGFHELDVETKKEYYSRDYDTKYFLYNTNFNLLQSRGPAAWRDTLTFIRGPSSESSHPDPGHVCMDVLKRYTNEAMKLGETLYGLLSEALGLHRNYLKEIGCLDGIFAPCNYYPACPEPHMTLGSAPHVDSGFITLLATNRIPGLQLLYQGRWIDVVPAPGALVVNIGTLMQLITNDRFVAALHRVLASKEGPRISMACIFRTHHHPDNTSRLYEPIKELLSEDNPALYRPVTVKDIVSNKVSTSTTTTITITIGNSLDKFKL